MNNATSFMASRKKGAELKGRKQQSTTANKFFRGVGFSLEREAQRCT